MVHLAVHIFYKLQVHVRYFQQNKQVYCFYLQLTQLMQQKENN